MSNLSSEQQIVIKKTNILSSPTIAYKDKEVGDFLKKYI